MTSYAAAPFRLTLKITTGGRRLFKEMWHDAMWYVRCSNAWPKKLEE